MVENRLSITVDGNNNVKFLFNDCALMRVAEYSIKHLGVMRGKNLHQVAFTVNVTDLAISTELPLALSSDEWRENRV